MLANAQTNLPPVFIKGGINITYNSRQTSPPAPGVKDIYALNINMDNSVVFHGNILDTPQLITGAFIKSVTQPRKLDYDVPCDVVNPKNVSQTLNVGRMYGTVPISSDGVYHYENCTLAVDILPRGSASGFTSKFGGTAAGKPLVRPANWLDTFKSGAINITRTSNGKTATVVLKKYDKMEFRQCILAAGPVQFYQPVTLNGELIYDYEKECWFLNNIQASYPDGGVIRSDHISGTMRWVKSPQHDGGDYQFDVRVNEPLANETAFTETKASDESAFFETDTKIPALTGTMHYKDTTRGETTLASTVTIDLTGNGITKQQAMVLCKMIIFAAVVPMNSD